MLKAILIDDEKAALDVLENDLNRYCSSDVTILGKFSSAIKGMQAIRKLKPDLIFLDIVMPEMTGFEMLEILGQLDVPVIFVSGFDQYAVKAFEISAVDYLLKPVDKDRLQQSIEKVKKTNNHLSPEHLKVLLENMNPQQKDKRIPIPSTNPKINGYDFISTSSIMYCKADKNYTYLYLFNKEKPILVSKGLGTMEDLLDKHIFFRPHASHIINSEYIQSIDRGGYVIMKDGQMLNVSSSKRKAFLKWAGLSDK